MPSNITLDDSSSVIVYSPNWAAVNKNDPSLPDFFQSTYHGAQADQAYANLTFTGSSVYIYGTKGPSHANYSIQFDGYIIFYSASAPTLQYKQPLFAFTFNETGSHFISLRTHYVDGGNWLDLDYITITAEDTVAPVNASAASLSSPPVAQSIFPPWYGSSASTSSSQPTSNTSDASSAGNGSSSKLTMLLSIIFGGIIFVVACILLGFYLLGKRRRRRKNPEKTPLDPNSKHRPPPMDLNNKSAKHMTFTTATATHTMSDPSSTHCQSPFDSPLSSPGLLTPDALRQSFVRESAYAAFPRDLQTPTSAAFTDIPPPQYRDMYIPVHSVLERSSSMHIPHMPDSPYSQAFGCSLSRSATVGRQQLHTPTGSETMLSHTLTHSREGSGTQLISSHRTVGSHQDSGVSPSTALFSQALLQPPSPHPPPMGPLPARPDALDFVDVPLPHPADHEHFISASSPSSSPCPSPTRRSFASPPMSPNLSHTYSFVPSPSAIPSPSVTPIPIALTVDPNSFGIPVRRAAPPPPPPRAAVGPLRPQRPTNGGLLDWFGSLERRSMKNTERAMKAMEDGNSSKTNFLKMF